MNGVVIIAHGRAEAQAMMNALRVAGEAASSGMLDAFRALSAKPAEPVVPTASTSAGTTA